MLLVGGIPLFYMELALGQFYQTGAITCWGRLVPLFKGMSIERRAGDGFSALSRYCHVNFQASVIPSF